MFLGNFADILTNRPLVLHIRVVWFRPITEENFHDISITFFWDLPRDQPTRLCGLRGLLVDIYAKFPKNIIYHLLEFSPKAVAALE